MGAGDGLVDLEVQKAIDLVLCVHLFPPCTRF